VTTDLPFAPATLLLGLALLLIFGAVIAVPLFDRKRPAVPTPSPIEALHAARAETVREIRELDFDHRMGKISDDDHRRLRGDLVQRGAGVLRDIEALSANAEAPRERDVDAEIEQALSKLTARRADAARGKSPAGPVCSTCGAALSRGAKFCAECGAKVNA
jgi:hypothetical protein